MKKSMKKIIPAFLMLGVAASMMATSSYAWFSMSREATVEGMQVQATADSSLVIGTSFDAVTDPKVVFSGNHTLAPATYMDGTYKFVSDTEKVDPSTGKPLDGLTFTYADAEEGTHFVDYIVYLATAGATELTGGNLKAQVTFTNNPSGALENEQLATTVDFYTKTATANVENPDTPLTKNGTNAAKNVAVTVASGITIPMNSSNESLAVIMRVYIDGALEDGSGKCYVKSSTVDLAAVNIAVKFTYGA